MAHADTDYARPARRRVGALLLIRNQSGHILIVQPSYKDGWHLVGGGALPKEAPHKAALRESVEETSLTGLTVGDLLLADYIPAEEDDTSAEGLNFVFDGGVVPDGTTITLPPALPGHEKPELIGWEFVSPDRLDDYCLPHQRQRITEALAALHDPAQRGYRVRGHRI